MKIAEAVSREEDLQNKDYYIFNALPFPALIIGSEFIDVQNANAAFVSESNQLLPSITAKGIFDIYPFSLLGTEDKARLQELLVSPYRNDDLIPVEFDHAVETGFFKTAKLKLSVVENPSCPSILLMFVPSQTIIPTQLENISDSSLDVICAIDDHGNFISVSAASRQVWGYEPGEMLGRPYIDFIIPQDHATTRKTAEQIISGAEITNFENRYLRKDGSVVPVVWSARWDNDKKVMFCVARNATEKQRVEQAVSFERKRYAELFMRAPGFICMVTGPTHVYQLANPVYEKLMGVSNIVGKTLKEAIPGAEELGFLTLLDQVYLTGKEIEGKELPIMIKRERDQAPVQHYLDLTCQPYRNAQNEIEGIFIFGTDVTQHVAALKELEEVNQRYQYVTRATLDAIWDWDLIDNSVIRGDGFQNMLGYSMDQLTNISWTENLHPDDLEWVSNSIAAFLKGSGTNWTEEYRYKRANGKYAFVVDRGIVIRNETGKPVRMVGALRDITGRKEHEQALQQSEARMKGIVNSQTNYLIRTDISGKYTYYNEKFLADFGWLYPSNDLMGQESLKAVSVSHHKMLASTLKNCLKNPDKVFQVEIDRPGQSGEVRTTLWDFTCLTDHRDLPAEIQGVGIDISDRKRAEEALVHILDEKNTILESIGDGFFAINNDSIVTYYNKRAEELLKTKREEVLGRNLHEMFANPSSIAFYNQYQKAIKEQSNIYFEEFSTRANKWFGVSAFATAQGLSVYFRDISEQKESEIRLKEMNEDIRRKAHDLEVSNDELRKVILERDAAMDELIESKKSYRDLFHVSPQPMWVYDIESLRFLNVNNSAVRQYGYTREEFLSMTIRDIRPIEEVPRLEAAVEVASSPDQPFTRGIFIHQKKNGERIHVDVQSNEFSFGGRRSRLILASNVTNAVRYLEAIEEQNRKLQDIAYTQSHIVRAPLARMLGILNIINEADLSASEQKDWLVHMGASLHELDGVIHEIVKKTERINVEQIRGRSVG